MNSYVECLKDEIDNGISEANSTQDEWSRSVDSFNNQ